MWKSTTSNKTTTERSKSNKRWPTFDENKFLTNRRTVDFDEIFRWWNFFTIQYSSSLDFAFNMWKSNCAGREQRWCYGGGIKNEARGSSADWPAPAYIAECFHQIQVSRAHTAGSGWFKRNKEKFRAFSRDPAMWSCVLDNDVAALLNGGNFVVSESQ